MPLKIRRKNGEITDFINSEYLPAYYFIPKEILDKCGKKLNGIPRNIKQVVSSWDAIETVESDLFAQCIIDAYAYMVWPYMGLNAAREAYSGYLFCLLKIDKERRKTNGDQTNIGTITQK